MRGAQAYQAIALDTTPRHRLVEVVLERAIAHIARAEEAIARRDPATAHDGLMRAQMALGALRTSLRREVAPELVDQLAALYTYGIDRLTAANVRKDASELGALRRMLDVLREAFADAARQAGAGGAGPTAEVKGR
ncbi:MAG: flagellar export chaperone FliS [Firmicutes bacterium]|nr:flagellar export chaperone FliS [Bacillota bacterium]